MPRFRRYGRRRFRRRRIPFRAKTDNVGQRAWKLARSAYMKTKKLQNRIGKVEYKKYDSAAVGQAVTNVLQFDNLHAIAQGAANNQRIGDKIDIKKLHLRWQVEMSQSEVYTTVRIMVFRWSENSIPVPADILSSTSTVRSYLNTQESHHFKMYYDRIFTLNIQGNSTMSGQVNKIINDLAVYDGPLATDRSDGAIYIGYIAEYVAVNPTLDYSSRLRFVDA